MKGRVGRLAATSHTHVSDGAGGLAVHGSQCSEFLASGTQCAVGLSLLLDGLVASGRPRLYFSYFLEDTLLMALYFFLQALLWLLAESMGDVEAGGTICEALDRTSAPHGHD